MVTNARGENMNHLKPDDKTRPELVWPNKSRAFKQAFEPSDKRLSPQPSISSQWDKTKNIYIEGDNLDALKLLLPDYRERIKLVYIDPPYNTGNCDLIYGDMFQYAWLDLMYPRLILTRYLLAKNGVIFISIDDHEVASLRCLCDEVFGRENFIAQIVWERAYVPVSARKHFSQNHEYIVVYAKDRTNLTCNGLHRTEETNSRYKNPDNDPRGPWQSDNLTVGPVIPEKCYPIVTPSGRVVYPPHGRCWLFTKERFMELVADNRIWFGRNGNGVPRLKRFLSEVQDRIPPKTIWHYTEVGHTQQAKMELKQLFEGLSCFDYPKPVSLILRIIQLYSDRDAIVLDYFSGSATTAHAVMLQNALDGGARQFIMVQRPDPINQDAPAFQAGFRDICEIGRARIQKAAQLIQDKSGAQIDYGFRVYRITE